MAVWRSKLGGEFPRELIERLDAEHHRLLRELRKKPENARCAECGAGDTAWASVSLGVFVCVRCADVHRALGTHISKMKGCGGTYLWGPDEIEQMQEVGNARARELYCGAGNVPQLSAAASKEELMDFCLKKYQHRLWAATSAPNTPPSKSPQAESACVPTHRIVKGGTCKASGAPESRAPAKLAEPSKQADLIDLDSFFDMLEDSGQLPVVQQEPLNEGPCIQEAQEPSLSQQPQSLVAVEGHPAAETLEAIKPNLDSFLDLCLNVVSEPTANSTIGPKIDPACKFARTPNAGHPRTDLKQMSIDFWADWGDC